MMQGELVTAVITTVDRIPELKRAIKSVERQTYKNMEIIVILDGTNLELKTMIDEFKEEITLPLEYIETGERKGGNFARNLGIRHAKGKYIALLDDDDEWLPEKIEKQIALCQSNNDMSIIFCSVINKMNNREVILPRQNYREGKENITDFLFSYQYGLKRGFIQTSTLFFSKKIFELISFDEHLTKHQDWDWVVQSSNQGITFKQIKEPLVIYHNESQDNRVGRSGTYIFSENWIEKNKNKISLKSYYTFMYTVVQFAVAKDSQLSAQEKKAKIFEIRRRVPFKYKCSITYLYYYIKSNRQLKN